MKRILLPVALVVVLAGVAGAWFMNRAPEFNAAAYGTIVFGVDAPYPPYAVFDSNGELTGFEVELGNRLCELLNLQCTWQVTAWDTIIDDLNADKFDEGQYRKSNKQKLESVSAGKKGLRAVVETDDQGGAYAWKVLSQTLAYAASLVPQIADDIAAVDEAMRLGTNWKKGPFEMIDQLGPKWFADKLRAEDMDVPELLDAVGEGTFYRVEDGKLQAFGTDGKYHDVDRNDGVLLLRDIKLSSEPVIKTASASVWDIGEGVLCVEFTGKMNALDEHVFAAYHKAI